MALTPLRKILLREWAINLLLSGYYLYFARVHAEYVFETGEPTTLIFLIYESLIIMLLLTRRTPKEVSFKSKDWIAATLGTFAPLMLTSQHQAFTGDFIILILQIIGMVISLVGMCGLNRSFGIVPANRGVQVSGLYEVIRHPIYAGYFLSLTCFTLLNLPNIEVAARNISILLLTLTAIIFRIRYEEALLIKDKKYQTLVEKTRYRILPGIW